MWDKDLEMTYPMGRLALIVVFVTAILAGVAANAAEPRRISHNESGSYEAFPDVCRLADGELVAVFYAGHGHISLPRPGSSKDGRICIMRSQDDGRTWSKPQTLVAGKPGDVCTLQVDFQQGRPHLPVVTLKRAA